MKPNSMSEVISVNHEELESLLKTSKYSDLPLMIYGTVGIGKSDKVREFSEEEADKKDNREFVAWNEVSKEKKQEIYENPEDYHVFLDIRLSEYGPEDLKGLPDLDGDGVEWQPPKWAMAICQEDAEATVFLDECNLAPPSVQKAFYKLILDRQIGEYTLSDDVFILGAGNIAGQDRADIQEFPAPLRNRFTHAHLKVPEGGQEGNWTKYAIQNDFHDLVVSFIGSTVGSEHLMNFEDGNRDAKAYATPRSWEFVSEMLKTAEENGELRDDEGNIDPRKAFTLASTAVGEGVAQPFQSFVQLREEIDFRAYLDDPEKAKELKEDYSDRMDLQRSVVTGLATEYKSNTDLLDEVLEISLYLRPEIGSLMLQFCKEYHPRHFRKEIYNSEVADQVAEKYANLISDE